MTGNTSVSNISAKAMTAFRLRLKGEIILPGEEGYEAARAIHNAVIDRRPAMFVKVRDAADVSRAIHFARQQGLALSVKSGGHGFNGGSLVDGGLVIDLSGMDEIRIDPEAKIAWVQAGATAAQVTAAAQEHGLAVPFGDASTVGVGGITLGGGVGYLARKHGLTIDNLAGVELVTAEGQIVHASETEHSELFWGLRGGGGNFGVVTGFQYRLVEVGDIYGGLLVLPASKEVIARYAALSLDAPEELTTIAALLHCPPLPFVAGEWVGRPVLGIFTCYAGDPAKGAEALAPFRALAEPVADILMPMPYAAIYQLTEDLVVRSRETVRSSFYQALDDRVVEGMIEHLGRAVSPRGLFQIRPLGGAVSRVSPEATAYSHRDAKFIVSVITVWDEAAEDEANRAWRTAAWDAIRGEGVYVNFLEDEGESRLREAYSQRTFARLAELKAAYDPGNVFASNQNIAPARRSAAA